MLREDQGGAKWDKDLILLQGVGQGIYWPASASVTFRSAGPKPNQPSDSVTCSFQMSAGTIAN